MLHALLDDTPLLIIAILTAILGVGRLTRVIVHDAFPPTIWLRLRWDELTDKPGTRREGWNKLLHCWWCASWWVTLVCIGWFIAACFVPWIGVAWWIFWGSLAIAYVAAIVIARDEPSE